MLVVCKSKVEAEAVSSLQSNEAIAVLQVLLERTSLRNKCDIWCNDPLLMSLDAKVEKLATENVSGEVDLEAADVFRAKEASDLTALEKELNKITDTSKRNWTPGKTCLHFEAEECEQCRISTLCDGSSLYTQLNTCRPADCTDARR